MAMALTPRQLTILHVVTESYIRTGSPVSSKAVAGLDRLQASPSTIRNEFAVLEELGYLTHPHTSAGRLPTSKGYREYVDRLMKTKVTGESSAPPVLPEKLAREVDDALRQTSEAMAEATNLLALVVAPLASGARLRHVELLLLQPSLVMIVFILSTGRVSKAIVDFPARVDAGMVEWARSYLNELMGDHILTERLARCVLGNPEMDPKERRFLDNFLPAFRKLLDESSAEALYIGGASRLLAEAPFAEVEELRDLLQLLEERYLLLRTLRAALSRGEVFVRIGEEHQEEALRRFSMVASSYGLPQRSLGTVSLLGPLRMDYQAAISTVRGTAQLLSTFLEDRYE
jgi:heat-inducible transcriptional repressor